MKALVTGGGGFLGSAIVQRLLDRGGLVRSFSRNSYRALWELGVEEVHGDLGDPGAVSEACRGVDVVFHAAAKAGYWGPYKEYYRTNVSGTRNVIEACRKHGIKRLVYTSSPSVIATGHDLNGVDESVPYPNSFKAHYPATKAEAERMVLAANSPTLATIALRPHLIWGPGDNHILPRLAASSRAGKLKRIGSSPCLVDSTYIDNAADAHLLAADCLATASAAAGKAYFISNGEPLPLWDLVNRLLEAVGAPRVTQTASPKVVYAAGLLLEAAYRVLPLHGEPPMTRFLAEEMSTAHWFDLTAAKRDLGYQPKVSVEQGLARLRESFRSVGSPVGVRGEEAVDDSDVVDEPGAVSKTDQARQHD
jgi:nucleoside-diphosphate-sugar epimerase